jgi:hypothetical protein
MKSDVNPDKVSDSISALQKAIEINDVPAVSNLLQVMKTSGVSHSYSDIAVIYELGSDCVKQRDDWAYDWYVKSAFEEDDKNGFFSVGRFHFNGRHVKRDYAESMKFFSIAHQMGSIEATVMLGYSYMKGLGAPVDLLHAKALLEVAAAAGYVVALGLLSRIEVLLHHRLRGLALRLRCIFSAYKISRHDPRDPRLFFLLDPRFPMNGPEKDL